ncbi:hypothetical protein ACS8Y6_17450 [Salinisphaera sp. RV14]
MRTSRILRFIATGCGLFAGVIAADPWHWGTTVTLPCGGLLLLIAIGVFVSARLREDRDSP